MIRVTKENYKCYVQNPRYINKEACKYLDKITYKLGYLEDIEKELGIELETLFNALMNGFYYKYYDEWIFIDKENICFDYQQKIFGFAFDLDTKRPKSLFVGLKRYKEKWCLLDDYIDITDIVKGNIKYD